MTPLAVYDVRDGSYVCCDRFKPFDAWVTQHGISLADTYRIEVHLMDCLFARVFQYDTDVDGRRRLDPQTHDVARRAPFDVLVGGMPSVEPAGTGL